MENALEECGGQLYGCAGFEAALRNGDVEWCVTAGSSPVNPVAISAEFDPYVEH